MAGDCCTQRYDEMFDDEHARRDLHDYRERGPDGSTQRLIDALIAEGVEGARLLDIGGGIGAIQLELLAAGVSHTQDVDASGPYLAAARAEAEERGFADRTAYAHGDFVALADEVEPAEIVTLDRVICCYPDAEALVGRSLAHATRLYGLVYPRDRWWVRLAFWFGNLVCAVRRDDFRIHPHRQATLDRLTAAAGFTLRYRHAGWVWQTAVWARSG